MTLIPVVVFKDFSESQKMASYLIYYDATRGLPTSAITLTFGLLFFICYMLGLRYNDIGWAFVAFAFFSLNASVFFSASGEKFEWASKISQLGTIASVCAGWIAIHSFCRRSTSVRLQGAFFCTFVAFRAARVYRVSFLGDNDYIPWSFFFTYINSIGYFLLFLVLRKPDEKDVPALKIRQRKWIRHLTAVAAIAELISSFLSYRYAIDFSSYVLFAILTSFGLFLIYDLVIYHRSYFMEKFKNADEIRQREALEDHLELGQKIQMLLMPAKGLQTIGQWQIFSYAESAERMAGDWYTYWKDKNRIHVLCGDVVGKGPEAAIASTAILSNIDCERQRESQLPEILASIDQSLHRMFKTSMVTTVSAATLHENGLAQILCQGMSGWFYIPVKGDVKFFPGNGHSLGSNLTEAWKFHDFECKVGDRIFTFSDGVADGARAMKKIFEGIKKLDKDISLPSLSEWLLAAGEGSALVDDKTIVAVEFRPQIVLK